MAHNNGTVSLTDYGKDAEEFPAYILPESWNGAAIPSFDRATVDRIIAWSRRMSELYPQTRTVEWDGATVVVADPECPDQPERVSTDADGRWPIGARSWCWTGRTDPVGMRPSLFPPVIAYRRFS